MSDTVIPTTPPPQCVIGANGITVPTFEDCYNWIVSQFQAIYGVDIYIAEDSQDGQLLGIYATALNDINNSVAAAYYAFSPSTAQGAGLSTVVKINGIRRLVPSNSTVDLTIVGVAGTTINNGTASDNQGNTWVLPNPTIIPFSGTITVTATANVAGAINVGENVVDIIGTPTLGWQSVTNEAASAPGLPVETDAALRNRQTVSTSLPAKTVLASTIGALSNLPGVSLVNVDENFTNVTNSNGTPAHSIAVVIIGGDDQQIANTIGLYKGPGGGTFGTTSEVFVDTYGRPATISFSRPTDVTILVVINITPLTGYTSAIGNEIIASVSAYINALLNGSTVMISRLYVPAQLAGPFGQAAALTDSSTYELNSILIAVSPGSPGSSDLPMTFSQKPVCAPANITLVT